MEWISVEDRLPKKSFTCVIIRSSCDCPDKKAEFIKDQGFIANRFLCKSCFDALPGNEMFIKRSSGFNENVTHWRLWIEDEKQIHNDYIDLTIEQIKHSKSLCPEESDRYDEIICELRKKRIKV